SLISSPTVAFLIEPDSVIFEISESYILMAKSPLLDISASVKRRFLIFERVTTSIPVDGPIVENSGAFNPLIVFSLPSKLIGIYVFSLSVVVVVSKIRLVQVEYCDCDKSISYHRTKFLTSV